MFGLTTSPLLLLTIASVIMTSAIFTLLISMALKSENKLIMTLMITFLYFSSPVQGWILDQGLMYAEIWQVTSLFLLLIMIDKIKNTKSLLNASILMSLSAFFRATGFTIIQISFLVFSLLFLINKYRNKKYIHDKTSIKQDLKYIFIPLISYSFCFIWILIRDFFTNVKTFNWVITGSNWSGYWQSNSDLIKSGWGVTAGVDNWACQLDLLRCAALKSASDGKINYLYESIQVILNHPFEFVVMRLSHFWSYWILNGRWLYPPQNRIPEAVNYLEGSIFLFFLIISVIIAIRNIDLASSKYILIMLFGTIAPLAVFHLESRYFIPSKILSTTYIVYSLQTHKIIWKKIDLKRVFYFAKTK